MALTPNPLVWEFSHKVANTQSLGGVVHYYDEQAQQIYIQGGLATGIAEVDEGHWKENPMTETIQINTTPTTQLRLDHALNGTVSMASIEGGKLVYQRYQYAMDISSLMIDWVWSSTMDSPIQEFTGSVQNIGPLVYADDLTLFQPGSRIRVGIKVGESDLYLIGISWLDETNLDVSAESITISGRNSIGYFLRDQTFDDAYAFPGQTGATINSILDYAGVKKYMVQANTSTDGFEFKPSAKLLDGLQEIVDYYSDIDTAMKMIELPDGTVMVGFDKWLEGRYTNGFYSFDDTDEIFKRKTNKVADSSYTGLRVTGKQLIINSDGEEEEIDLNPVTVPIVNFKYWGLGKHRTKHLEAPGWFKQADLQKWAEAKAKTYQYIGIGEDFTGPFRPQILVGDVAEAKEGSSLGISLGLITEAQHKFSRSGGYSTEFSVDSGGVTTDGAGYVIYSRAAETHGFNRRQRIVDLVRLVSGK